MRNAKRIPVVLEAVKAYWRKHPDLRLGQIISNLTDNKDVFYIEDEELLQILDDILKKVGHNGKSQYDTTKQLP